MDEKFLKTQQIPDKSVVKINSKNNIYSIIEFYQQFNDKYNIKLEKLDDAVLYQTNKRQIAQTYKTTLLNTDFKTIKDNLKNIKNMTILIIEDTQENNSKINRIIKQMNNLNNITTKRIRQDDFYKTLNSIIKEDI